MLTSYITTKNLRPLSSVYLNDMQLDLLNQKICVDGNLNAVYTPLLSSNNDFTNNNYSLLNLTEKIQFEEVANIQIPENKNKIYFGLLSLNLDNNSSGETYWSFSGIRDDILTNTIYFDQVFTTPASAITDNNFFEFDLTDPSYCTISHMYKDQKYFLSFDPAKGPYDQFNLNFVILSGFNDVNNYTRYFNYVYDEAKNLITFFVKTSTKSFQVCVANYRLQFADTTSIQNPLATIGNCIFTLSAFKLPSVPRLSNEWGSYERSLNQNNLNIDAQRSFTGLTNNVLSNREYYNIKNDYLPTNILTLKNQLNINNEQGRGNVILNDETVSYRDYTSIYSGGNQEKGFTNLHLGYDCYSTPYLFSQGKTTWFHMPQNMYPYKRLNVNTSKLIQAGAIAGDHPLRSDKIWKKLGEYRSTSNQGDTINETTGQWLCTWLSGGPSVETKPVWVDRFYTPSKATPYQALSANPTPITVNKTYDCLSLPTGVYDVISNLTFEPGCWYAYSHIGASDVDQNIKLFSTHLQQQGVDQYLRTDGSILDILTEDNIDTLKFTGSEYAYFDVIDFNLPQNIFTINFWANSDDWSAAKGYEIAGNFNDYGLGIFNYNFVTPFIFYLSQGKIIVLNRDFEELTTYDGGLSAFGNIVKIFRRDALNTFHALTDKQYLIEYDMKETLVDATPLSSTKGLPIYVSNNETEGTLLYADGTLSAVNLFSNLPVVIDGNLELTIGDAANVQEAAKLVSGKRAKIAGTQTQLYGTNAYFLSANKIYAYFSDTDTLSAVFSNNPDNYTTFKIDKNSFLWAASGNQIKIYNAVGSLTRTLTLTAGSDISQTPVKIQNITFLENFDSGKLITDALISASGSAVGNVVLFRLAEDYEVTKIKNITTNTDILTYPDPSNHTYNYSYLKNRYFENGYTFKIRLYNPLDTEDVEIPQLFIAASQLNSGYHQFTIVINCVQGLAKLYVDGQLYASQAFTPNKYIFTPLVVNRILIGTSPYYGGTPLFEYLDKNKTQNTSYMCRGFDVQHIRFYNTELNYYDIMMLYREKKPSENLVWDVPSGKRVFVDAVSRYFKNKVPGSKSGMFNVWVNSNLLSEESKQVLEVGIQQKIKEISPAYSKLNKINWFSNNPAISGDYLFPNYPGNTLTTGELIT